MPRDREVSSPAGCPQHAECLCVADAPFSQDLFPKDSQRSTARHQTLIAWNLLLSSIQMKNQPEYIDPLQKGHVKQMRSFATTALLSLCLFGSSAHAENTFSERRFGYTYPSLTQPIGEIEFETWGTWKNRCGSMRDFKFSHEFEIGITQQTQVGLSLANWTIDARTGEKRYLDSSVEIIQNISNPLTDLLGSAIALELAMGDRSSGVETRLILEKRFGKWILGWNASLEAEWEGNRAGDLHDSTGELNQSIGIGYDVAPWVTVGLEMLQIVPLEKWHAPANTSLYAGPSATFRHKNFRATIATLFQTTDRTSEPSVQLRSIIGLEF